MSIHLNIKTENPEVEALLTFMQSRFPNADDGDHIVIMNEAIKILRTVDDYKFMRAGEVSLDFGCTDPKSSLHSDMPVQSPVLS
jgi:hypothetical protein